RLSVLRQTRIGRIVRLVAIVTCTALLGGMGFVWWQQHSFDSALREADAELDQLLAAGDRAGARERWQHWADRLGDCEPIADLRSRVDFADAAERTRLEKLRRRHVADRLTEAGTALETGEVERSLQIYRELWTDPKLQTEVAEAATARLRALLDAV